MTPMNIDHETRHDQELQVLFRISQILAAGSGQRQMLAEVLDVLANDLGMTLGTIALLMPDGRELSVEVAHNLPDRQRRAVKYRLGEGIFGRVVQSGKPMIVPRVSQEPLFLDRLHNRKKVGKSESSFICVPVAIGNEVVGALSADKAYDPAAPLKEDARLLSIVAGMIANDVRSRG